MCQLMLLFRTCCVWNGTSIMVEMPLSQCHPFPVSARGAEVARYTLYFTLSPCPDCCRVGLRLLILETVWRHFGLGLFDDTLDTVRVGLGLLDVTVVDRQDAWSSIPFQGPLSFLREVGRRVRGDTRNYVTLH
jgi:hypothetical protein